MAEDIVKGNLNIIDVNKNPENEFKNEQKTEIDKDVSESTVQTKNDSSSEETISANEKDVTRLPKNCSNNDTLKAASGSNSQSDIGSMHRGPSSKSTVISTVESKPSAVYRIPQRSMKKKAYSSDDTVMDTCLSNTDYKSTHDNENVEVNGTRRKERYENSTSRAENNAWERGKSITNTSYVEDRSSSAKRKSDSEFKWNRNQSIDDIKSSSRQYDRYKLTEDEDDITGSEEYVVDLDDVCHKPKPKRDVLFKGQYPARKTKKFEQSVIDSRFLEDIAGNEPSQIVLTLSNLTTSLNDVFTNCNTDSRLLKLLVRVLAKAFACESLSSSVLHLVTTAKDAKLFDTITLHLMDVLFDYESCDKETTLQFVGDVMTMIWELTIKNPADVEVLSRTYTTLKKLIALVDTTTDPRLEHLETRLKEYTEYKEALLTRKQPQKAPSSRVEVPPPEDFRTIDVFPQTNDIHTHDDPFVRANKKEGGYVDLNHYLDVQFRLLREDFIGPLREGIQEYADAQKSGKFNPSPQDVRIYKQVKVLTPVYMEGGTSYSIQLQLTGHLKNVNWKSSKRLIYGSLVCMSDDNYNTFFFASVVHRDEEEMKNGILQVRFEHNKARIKSLMGKSFTMLETSAYFESYRHVLTGLQNFRDGELPFQKYIVSCEVKVKPPVYLQPDSKYDLRPLVDATYTIQPETKLKSSRIFASSQTRLFSSKSELANQIPILQPSAWPSKDLLHLDASQFSAINDALTKEFAIIQGPPGTGKTYIGLQIAKALLHNKNIWSIDSTTNKLDERPMLIVCYTNHALDQFLEGIIKFYKGDVLRVGGRSENRSLDEHNLKRFRSYFRQRKLMPAELEAARIIADDEFEEISSKINILVRKIQVCEHNLVHEKALMQYIETHLFQSLTSDPLRRRTPKNSKQACIKDWLGVENMTFDVDEIGEKTKEVDANIDVKSEAQQIQSERQLDTDEINKDILDAKFEHVFKNFTVPTEVQFKTNIKEGTKEWDQQKHQKKALKRYIRKQLMSKDVMSEVEVRRLGNVWALRKVDKWRLYRFWVERLTDALRQQIENIEDDFEETAKHHAEIQMQEDKEILRKTSVIGMTTTGAARYRSILQEIKPRIIIVEEAAEVLEAHIITTLSSKCEHLILIGDHKQLRPSPTVYKLAIKYNLNLSLFERMINNGVKFNTLQLQHRMRPEIAQPLRNIYDNLQDDESVKNYEDVNGISTNMCLINHSEYETNDSEKSYSNLHEAEYAVALCKHLILQGYSSDQITILTLYSGQQFCLRNLMPRETFQGVIVRVVDKYQGEENDIVILSLVRSNRQGQIGFLKTENRICVALSRAKIGFYVLGNFGLLAEKSQLWKRIVIEMKSQNRLNEGLPLYCQNHPVEEGIVAKCASDFRKAPEGGCSLKCNARLSCGHTCAMYCHVQDKDHEQYLCKKKCIEVLCTENHICPRECFQSCGPCEVPVEKTVPKCQHNQQIPCHISPSDFKCKDVCKQKLMCGHDCTKACGYHCTEYCKVNVEKKWTCGHSQVLKCHEVATAICQIPCGVVLKCDHECSGTCGICYNERLHQPCRIKCKKKAVCGHRCQGRCQTCPPCTLACGNRCPHSACEKPCGEPCAPCIEPCAWSCPHFTCHKPCHELCDRPRCDEPCPKLLHCQHKCIGLCGEPCPRVCRICDKKEKMLDVDKRTRFVMLIDCGHIFEQTRLDKYMAIHETLAAYSTTFAECPTCKIPIRQSLRYGSYVKIIHKNIERAKQDTFGDQQTIRKLKRECDPMLENSFRETLKNQIITEVQMKQIKETIEISKTILTLQEDFERNKLDRHLQNSEMETYDFLSKLLDWIGIPRYTFTAQEKMDCLLELDRSHMYVEFKKLELSLASSGSSNSATVKTVAQLSKLLTSNSVFTETEVESVKMGIESLQNINYGDAAPECDAVGGKIQESHDIALSTRKCLTGTELDRNSNVDESRPRVYSLMKQIQQRRQKRQMTVASDSDNIARGGDGPAEREIDRSFDANEPPPREYSLTEQKQQSRQQRELTVASDSENVCRTLDTNDNTTN